MQEKQNDTETKLQQIERREEIAGKKCGVYSRLLMNPALAQAMEKLSLRHEERRQALLCLQGKKHKAKEGEEI